MGVRWDGGKVVDGLCLTDRGGRGGGGGGGWRGAANAGREI